MEDETEAFIESYKIKKRVVNFIKRYDWILVISLTIFSWILGYIGYWVYFKETGVDKSITDIAYATFQLFVFDSGSIESHPPFILDIARFLSPFTLVYAAFIAFMWFINKQYKLVKLTWFKDHTIFMGIGKHGKQLLADLQRSNEKIVVVTKEEPIPGEIPNHPKTVLITQENRDNKLLDKIQIEHAKYVMCMDDGEHQNLSAGTFISDYLKLNSKGNNTKIFIQTSTSFIEQLRDLDFEDKASDNHKLFDHKVHFFSIYERAAHLIAKKYSPDKYVNFLKESNTQAHILIAGFDDLGQALLLQVGKMFHFANRNRLKVSVIHNDKDKVDRFIKKYPGAEKVMDLNFIPQDEIDIRNIYEKTGNSEIHTIYICVADGIAAIEIYNTVNQFIVSSKIILCYENSDNFLERIVRENVYHFRVNEETINMKSIVKEDIDKQAMLVHQSYMLKEEDNNDNKIKELKKLTHQDWEKLTERTKNANRNQAEHIEFKLRAAGCIAKDDPNIDNNKLYDFNTDKKMLEILAEIEHRRWNAGQLLNGWIYGKKRNDQLQIHDNIIPYDDLKDPVKKYDRDAILNIPLILSVVKKKVVKL